MTVKARPLQEFFPGGSAVKNSPANARHVCLIPGSERSPGEENDNPFQYSCLGNPMDREARRATILGVAKSWTQFRDKHLWKMHESGLTEVIPLMCTSAIWGQCPAFLHAEPPQGSPSRVTVVTWWLQHPLFTDNSSNIFLFHWYLQRARSCGYVFPWEKRHSPQVS